MCRDALSSRPLPARAGRGLRGWRGWARAWGPPRTAPALPARSPHCYPQDTCAPVRHPAPRHDTPSSRTFTQRSPLHGTQCCPRGHPLLPSSAHPSPPRPALPHYGKALPPGLRAPSRPRPRRNCTHTPLPPPDQPPHLHTHSGPPAAPPRAPDRVVRALPRVRACPRAGTAGGAPLPSRPRSEPGPLSRGRRPGAEPSAMGAEREAGGAAAAAGGRRRRRSARGGGRGAP